MSQKIGLDLGPVQKTLLLPLWGRAVESRKKHPALTDELAVEIISKIDYDFSTIAQNISPITQFAWIARSIHTDSAIRRFLERFPDATIVDIGCGLDTTFSRIDNGRLLWYDLDLPDVIALRKQFIGENERRIMISSSFLDSRWLDHLMHRENVMIIAAGVFYYFTEQQIRDFFTTLADRLTHCEVFFDSASPFGVRTANQKVIKDGGMDESAVLKWGIRHAKVIESWDPRMHVLREIPMFSGMKKGLSLKQKYGLFLSDVLKVMSIIHLQIGNR